MKRELIQRIEAREAYVGIVGVGYVGLPLALRFSEAGFSVIGFDSDPLKTESIANGQSYLTHIRDDRIRAAAQLGFRVTSNIANASMCDVVIICLPTPLGKHQEPDLSYVTNAMDSLTKYISRGKIICLESTTYPGTTDEEIVTRLERAGLTIGEEIFVVYSPEREDPGNKDFNTQTIPKVVGGYTDNCLSVGKALYGQIIDEVVPVSSTRAAEMTKLLENIHRAVNIGLVNELKMVADKMGIDIFEVINAAASKPFGFTPYFPGPGLGGHCIPIDPFYLTWKAREFGVNTRFIELAGQINSEMPNWVLSNIERSLNKRGKAINGSKILIVGIAYKKDTNDTRESPGIEIYSNLEGRGANVSYHDPYVLLMPVTRKYQLLGESTPLTHESIANQDCVLICTDHTNVDYHKILKSAKLIVDTRGVYQANGVDIVLS
jgi:UDP-N-acetyl-D-glucosamine dehydrogenase